MRWMSREPTMQIVAADMSICRFPKLRSFPFTKKHMKTQHTLDTSSGAAIDGILEIETILKRKRVSFLNQVSLNLKLITI